MCYSEKLDQAGGYAEEHGYVLVGYKVVVKCGSMLMPHNLFTRNAVNLDAAEMDMMSRHGRHFRDRLAQSFVHERSFTTHIVFEPYFLMRALATAAEGVEHPHLPPRQLLQITEGRHGFHVAASEYSAINQDGANPFGKKCRREAIGDPSAAEYVDPSRATEAEYLTYREVWEPNPPGALVRVLVPEHAVDETNHVHAMVVIPPGKKETEADIAMCDEWNRKHRPQPEPQLESVTG